MEHALDDSLGLGPDETLEQNALQDDENQSLESQQDDGNWEKRYKDVQGFATQTSQMAKALEKQNQMLVEQNRMLSQQLQGNLSQPSQPAPESNPWEGDPETKQVVDQLFSEFERRMGSKIDPLIKTVQGQHIQSVANRLDAKYPGWREHSGKVQEVIRRYGANMMTDVDNLAKLSLPAAILNRKAREQRNTNAQSQGAIRSMTTRTPKQNLKDTIFKSFSDCVDSTRNQLGDEQ